MEREGTPPPPHKFCQWWCLPPNVGVCTTSGYGNLVRTSIWWDDIPTKKGDEVCMKSDNLKLGMENW